MENLSYCLNATTPIFLLMVLGMLLRRIGLLDEVFTAKLNKFVFQLALPVTLFQSMSKSDFFTVWDGSFVLFCFCATLASILIAAALSFLLKDKASRGEFVQVSYRSNTALLGIALMENLYGTAAAAPLMIIGAVPLYNVAAVTVLNVMHPEGNKAGSSMLLRTLKGVVTNPILIGVLTGCLWSVLRIPQPPIFAKTISSIAACATPLGLLTMGANFNPKKATGALRPALCSTALKLVVFTGIFVPLAAALGFGQDKLVAVLIMTGAPSAVSCYIMAHNLGYEGTLTTNTVMLTTMFAAFTLTFWLWVTRTLGLI